MTNAELIAALRYCISDEYVEKGCLICPICAPRQGEMKCNSQDDAIKYAADALEADDKRIDCLQKLVDINTKRCESLRQQLREAHESYEKHINELATKCNQLQAAVDNYEKRIAELENDLMCGTVSEPERFGINGYSMKDLLLFAEMCKRNDVSEADLKQAAWNLELAVRAVMNERQEIVKNTMDEIMMRFTPDFEKAYAEMRGENDDKRRTD